MKKVGTMTYNEMKQKNPDPGFAPDGRQRDSLVAETELEGRTPFCKTDPTAGLPV